MPRNISINDFPPRMKLMEAVAWIATREPVVVLRASLEETRHRKAMAILAAHDELDWCGNEPGVSLLAIDQRCSRVGAAEEAGRELLALLADGSIAAKASYFTPAGGWGPACQLPEAEWDSIALDTAGGKDRELVPFVRAGEGSTALTPVEEWRVIGIETESVLAFWPARVGQEGHSTGTKSPSVPCLTLEVAIARIKETLGYPDGPAGEVLVNALRQGKFLAWERRISGNRIFSPIDWQESFIIPANLDLHDSSSVRVGGNNYHLGRIVIAEDDFIFWLDRQSQPEPWGDKPWPAAPSAETRSVSIEPDTSAEADKSSQVPLPKLRRNKTGPKPEKRDCIVARMVADFDNRPDALAGEKVVLLTHNYGASKHTVTKAREQAMAELWKNSGRTLDTGK